MFDVPPVASRPPLLDLIHASDFPLPVHAAPFRRRRSKRVGEAIMVSCGHGLKRPYLPVAMALQDVRDRVVSISGICFVTLVARVAHEYVWAGHSFFRPRRAVPAPAKPVHRSLSAALAEAGLAEPPPLSELTVEPEAGVLADEIFPEDEASADDCHLGAPPKGRAVGGRPPLHGSLVLLRLPPPSDAALGNSGPAPVPAAAEPALAAGDCACNPASSGSGFLSLGQVGATPALQVPAFGGQVVAGHDRHRGRDGRRCCNLSHPAARGSGACGAAVTLGGWLV